MVEPKEPTFGPAGFPAFAGDHGRGAYRYRVPLGRGPVYFPAGRYVLFSDIPNNRIMRLDEDDDHCNVFRQPSMNSNGNTIDREGRLITCEHSGRRVTRTELDGSITIIADSYNGKKLNSPNDVVVASDGSIWFTDPAYGIGGCCEGMRPHPSRRSTTSFGLIRKPAASKLSRTTSSSQTASPSLPTRRSSMSSTRGSPTVRKTHRTSACSTWTSRMANCRTARSLS